MISVDWKSVLDGAWPSENASTVRYRSIGTRRLVAHLRPPMDGRAAHPCRASTAPACVARRCLTAADRLPAAIALGLTRRDAACPSWKPGSARSLQAIAIDIRSRLARAVAPGSRRTGTAARRAGGKRRPPCGRAIRTCQCSPMVFGRRKGATHRFRHRLRGRSNV